MRTFILAIAASAFLYVHEAKAQDFKDVLQKTVTTFNEEKDPAKRTEAANRLSLIAKKFNTEPAAQYYVAYSRILLSNDAEDKTKKDALLDEAEKAHDDEVSLLGKENDETYVLAAWIATTRLGVDPQNRWQKYGKIFDENLAKAKEINPDNPRIYFLQGASKRYTPKMFGGGRKAALPYFEKADGLFAKQKTGDITVISWGKETNDGFLKDCRKEDKEEDKK